MPQGNRFHTMMKDITLSASACISLVSLALVPRGTHVKTSSTLKCIDLRQAVHIIGLSARLFSFL